MHTASPSPFRFEAEGRTGSVMAHGPNEDAFGVFPHLGLFVIADGMGGYGAGDEASRLAVTALEEHFERTRAAREVPSPLPAGASQDRDEERLLAGVLLANRRIFEAGAGDVRKRGLGATIAALSLTGGGAHLAHAGDCRIYLLRGERLQSLTRDHSLVNEYQRYKLDITPEELAQLPRNIVTRALGVGEKPKIELQRVEPTAGDVYLLCTDGLHEVLEEAEILALLRERPAAGAAAEALVARALQRGGMDDITCVLVRLLAR